MGGAVADLSGGRRAARPPMGTQGGPRSRLGAALLVALALLLVGTGADAQAQRRRGPTYTAFPIVRVTVRPQQPRYRLCAGETRELLVDVSVTMVGGFHLLASARGMPAPTTARNSAPAIATLTGKADRPENYGVAEPFRGWRYDLKGRKPGTGTLTFTATLPENARASGPYDTWPAANGTTTVDYEVRPCDYEIDAVHLWKIPKTLATARMGIKVSADESGKLSGSGNLDWIVVHSLPACKSEDTVEPSVVRIDGQVAEDGKVTLTFDYETASGTSSYECPAPCRTRCSGSESYSMVPSKLPSLSFPGQGGSVTKKQTIPGGFRGTATITVTPVKR
jgi:hypothetical protein